MNPNDYGDDADAFMMLMDSVKKIRSGPQRVKNKIIEYLPQVVRNRSVICKELSLS